MDLLEVFKDSEDLISFSSGDVVFEEGKEGNFMYVVMEGEVTISLKRPVFSVTAVSSRDGSRI